MQMSFAYKVYTITWMGTLGCGDSYHLYEGNYYLGAFIKYAGEDWRLTGNAADKLPKELISEMVQEIHAFERANVLVFQRYRW